MGPVFDSLLMHKVTMNNTLSFKIFVGFKLPFDRSTSKIANNKVKETSLLCRKSGF